MCTKFKVLFIELCRLQAESEDEDDEELFEKAKHLLLNNGQSCILIIIDMNF